jgi:hypothetical protein
MTYQKTAFNVDVKLMELLDFIKKGDRIEDDAVTDDAGYVGVKNPGRDEVKDILIIPDDDSVTGVGASLIPRDDIDVFADMIDNFTFAFVAPLGSDNYLYWHIFLI